MTYVCLECFCVRGMVVTEEIFVIIRVREGDVGGAHEGIIIE